MSISLRSGEHVDLPSQQRRLRHLRSISARNLGLTDNHCTLLDACFTLHVPECKNEFYKSEVICQSLNPNWAALDPHSMMNKTDTAIPAFRIKVWALIGQEFCIVIDWLVDLAALQYLGETVHCDGVHYPPNSLIFGMFNGYYAAPPENYSRLSREALEASLSLKTLPVVSRLIKHSYTKWKLMSVADACQQLCCLRGDISSLKQRIGVDCGVIGGQRSRKREATRVRIRLLSDDLNGQAIQERSESTALELLKNVVSEKASSVKQLQVELSNLEAQFAENKQKLASRTNSLLELNARSGYRRSDLLRQLTQILPIHRNVDHYCIVGIRLPDAGGYSGADEDSVAAALGYVCQVVFTISQILGIPLTHPVSPASSFSSIRNEIRTDLGGNEREFQLFARTKNRERFGYGVYLLNQNIRQLRQNCGLQTNDMRFTLHNLFELFELFSQVHSSPPKSQARDIPYSTTHLVPNTHLPPSYSPPEFSDPSKQWLLPPNEPLPPPYETAVAGTLREQSPAASNLVVVSTANRQVSPLPPNGSQRSSSLPVNSTGHASATNEEVERKERDTDRRGKTNEEEAKDKVKTEETIGRGMREEVQRAKEETDKQGERKGKTDDRGRREEGETVGVRRRDETDGGEKANEERADERGKRRGETAVERGKREEEGMIGRQTREDEEIDGEERAKEEPTDKRGNKQGETAVRREAEETIGRTREDEGTDERDRAREERTDKRGKETAVKKGRREAEETIERTRDSETDGGDRAKEKGTDKRGNRKGESDDIGRGKEETVERRTGRDGETEEEEKGRGVNKKCSREEKRDKGTTTAWEVKPTTQTETETRKTSGQTSVSDPFLRDRPEENCEVSRHSPSLMRATTRLAGIGFGAKAAAQALKPGRRPRSQMVPTRTLRNEHRGRLEVKSFVGVDGMERGERVCTDGNESVLERREDRST